MTRISRDDWAMELALTTAKRSTCCRRQVGCVLLNSRGHVLSTGYNGVAAGLPHCNEIEMVKNPKLYIPESDSWRMSERWERDMVETYPNSCPGAFSPSGTNLDGCYAIHAEQNALLQCRDVWEIETCIVTTSPCISCCKLLLNTGCQRILFNEEYPHTDARSLWESSGRFWNKYVAL